MIFHILTIIRILTFLLPVGFDCEKEEVHDHLVGLPDDAAGPQSLLAEVLEPGCFVEGEEVGYWNGKNVVCDHVDECSWLLLTKGFDRAAENGLGEIKGHEDEQENDVFVCFGNDHGCRSEYVHN